MTIMQKEAREAPWVIQRQLKENKEVWEALCMRLKEVEVSFVMTIARGSSDHAATFVKYAIETQFGIPVCSAAPSVLTVYEKPLKLKNSLVIGISQSGQSPDIVAMMEQAKAAGAVTVAIVNQVASPLAQAAEYVVPMWAGEEQAVAATKSYIASVTAILQFISMYSQDEALVNALEWLPHTMEKASNSNWQPLLNVMEHAEGGVVLARGFGFPIAQEAALKFKETSSLHAEAFSSAEFLHGPMALVKDNFPVLIFLQNDQTLKGTLATAQKIVAAGGKTFIAVPEGLVSLDQSVASCVLPLPKSVHPLTDALLAIQAFYPMSANLALKRGYNPDAPDNLKKVTETR
jgi:glucosamine--fructose-6-phosphate aminotransferase (isomerizing)